MLNNRPLVRWAKRKPAKRAFILLALIIAASLYGVRVWNAGQHASMARGRGTRTRTQAQQMQDDEQQHGTEGLNWDLLEKPPLFSEYHQAEMALPQHHVKDPFANGKKYLWVENHVHGACPVAFVFASRV